MNLKMTVKFVNFEDDFDTVSTGASLTGSHVNKCYPNFFFFFNELKCLKLRLIQIRCVTERSRRLKINITVQPSILGRYT